MYKFLKNILLLSDSYLAKDQCVTAPAEHSQVNERPPPSKSPEGFFCTSLMLSNSCLQAPSELNLFVSHLSSEFSSSQTGLKYPFSQLDRLMQHSCPPDDSWVAAVIYFCGPLGGSRTGEKTHNTDISTTQKGLTNG